MLQAPAQGLTAQIWECMVLTPIPPHLLLPANSPGTRGPAAPHPWGCLLTAAAPGPAALGLPSTSSSFQEDLFSTLKPPGCMSAMSPPGKAAAGTCKAAARPAQRWVPSRPRCRAESNLNPGTPAPLRPWAGRGREPCWGQVGDRTPRALCPRQQPLPSGGIAQPVL